MLSKVLGGLSLVRHAVAITLVFGAAGATVAGAVDVSQSQVMTPANVSMTTNKTQNDNTSDLEAAVKACLASKDPASDACVKAVELSGLSAADFWAKVAFSLERQLGEAKHDKHEDGNTRELMGLVTACVASHERSSEPCAKALELSGLSADDFWAKVGALFENKKHDEPTPSVKPSEKPRATDDGDVSALIKACVAAYERVRQTHEGADAVKDICDRAIKASGLSGDAFWAKYYPKPTTTEQPRTTAKPQPTQRVSDADLQALVSDCFTKYTAATASKGNETLARAAYDACTEAIAASGLSGDAFWAKFGKPPAASN